MRITSVIGCALLLAGCTFKSVPDPALSARDAEFMALVPDAEFDPHFARYEVADPTRESPGTIVVETKERQLYLVLPGGKAIRYGVSVGDEPMAGPAPPESTARRNGRPGIPRPR